MEKEPKKRFRKSLTIAQKREIVKLREEGETPKEIAAKFAAPYSTITTILAQKEAIKNCHVPDGITKLFSPTQRSVTLNEMEDLLYAEIMENRNLGLPCSREYIQERAVRLHAKLQEESQLEGREQGKEFKASKSWFEAFRKRTGIHSVTQHGEAASADQPAADAFAEEFATMLKKEGIAKS